MTKSEIVDYLKAELKDVQKEYEQKTAEYNKAGHMERIGIAHSYDKIQDKYYYLYMLCNDIGITAQIN